MSKSRIMGAASCGTNYGVNKNSPGNGNGKWQGLWPSVGHAKNARAINIRAGGNDRNVVFCMNQLGGVGRISKMFATTADGVKDCGCILPSHVKEALHKLGDYALSQNKQLCLVGETETLSSDVPGHSGSFDKTFPTNLDEYVKIINDLKLEFAVTGPNDVQRHIVAMASQSDAIVLKEYGFGFPALCNNIIAYGTCCSCFMKKHFDFEDAGTTKPSYTNIILYFKIEKDTVNTFASEGIEIFLDQTSLTQDVFLNTVSGITLKLTNSLTGTGGLSMNFNGQVTGPNNSVLRITPIGLTPAAVGLYSVIITGNAMVTDNGSTGQSYPNTYYLMNLIGFRYRGPDPRLSFKLGTAGASCQFPTPGRYRT